MGIGGYKITDQSATYFVSFAVVAWVDVFTRKEYRDIVIESLKHCQEKKGLVIYGWCIMSNHLHLIISAKENNVSGVLGDFKKFTSKKLIDSILNNPGESRKEWMIKIFKEAGELNSRNTNYQFWQQDNEPKIIFTPQFASQKLEYIHNNPVEAGIVEKAEEYIYSSARDYYYGKQCGLIKIEFLL
ncbi:MAG TPA: transposase [Chitinophagaceae bacterium]